MTVGAPARGVRGKGWLPTGIGVMASVAWADGRSAQAAAKVSEPLRGPGAPYRGFQDSGRSGKALRRLRRGVVPLCDLAGGEHREPPVTPATHLVEEEDATVGQCCGVLLGPPTDQRECGGDNFWPNAVFIYGRDERPTGGSMPSRTLTVVTDSRPSWEAVCEPSR